MDQVGSATREHPEAQIQLELGRSSFSIQTLKGLEAALGPAGHRRTHHHSSTSSADQKWLYGPVQPLVVNMRITKAKFFFSSWTFFFTNFLPQKKKVFFSHINVFFSLSCGKSDFFFFYQRIQKSLLNYFLYLFFLFVEQSEKVLTWFHKRKCSWFHFLNCFFPETGKKKRFHSVQHRRKNYFGRNSYLYFFIFSWHFFFFVGSFLHVK